MKSVVRELSNITYDLQANDIHLSVHQDLELMETLACQKQKWDIQVMQFKAWIKQYKVHRLFVVLRQFTSEPPAHSAPAVCPSCPCVSSP